MCTLAFRNVQSNKYYTTSQIHTLPVLAVLSVNEHLLMKTELVAPLLGSLSNCEAHPVLSFRK